MSVHSTRLGGSSAIADNKRITTRIGKDTTVESENVTGPRPIADGERSQIQYRVGEEDHGVVR